MAGFSEEEGFSEEHSLRVFLDTNVFLRAILGDDPQKSADCLDLLDLVDNGKVRAVTSMLVVNEILWVLEGLGVGREEIVERLHAISNSRVDLHPTSNGETTISALDIYSKAGVDFQDIINAFTALSVDTQVIISYDSHFDKIDSVRRMEPAEVIGTQPVSRF
jgi:predicted nucleic acid-binding protein